MKYTFVISENCEEFEKMCNEMLSRGYVTSGGVNIAHYNSPPRRGVKPTVGTTYAQAFVKE
jgi:hypothetical protein